MESLKNKSAVITGGGSGIGKAIAEALVNEGVNVVIASRRKDVLEETGGELNSAGRGKAYWFECDLRNAAQIKKLAEFAAEKLNGIDILINNSGLGVQTKIIDCSEETWDLVMDTNLKGTFLLTREVLPYMIKNKSGYIINIASQAAKHGYPEAGPYCASKFGLIGFSEALQHEVREYNIHVHCLNPALVQVPAPESDAQVRHDVLQTEDLASTVTFLLKQPRRIFYENIGLYRF
ncbi:MAG: SDR family oxidoreductase [Syntrophothermus sp.]